MKTLWKGKLDIGSRAPELIDAEIVQAGDTFGILRYRDPFSLPVLVSPREVNADALFKLICQLLVTLSQVPPCS